MTGDTRLRHDHERAGDDDHGQADDDDHEQAGNDDHDLDRFPSWLSGLGNLTNHDQDIAGGDQPFLL